MDDGYGYDPELPTPTEAEKADAEGAVCGFPVDRTQPDWPGLAAPARDGGAG